MLNLKNKYYYLIVMGGFILLNIYLNIFIARTSHFGLQILLVILFFPLLKLILKATKLNDFKNIGIDFHYKWKRNLIIGFSIGFGFWLMMYMIKYFLNGFEIIDVKSLVESIKIFVLVSLTFFIGSFFNDIIIRGYIFGHLQEKINIKWIFIISITLYALDDIWNEGFRISNTLFSIILGLSLTYAIYYTRSIWLTTGIHWGLNVCYGIFNGMLGELNGGIFITTANPNLSSLIEVFNYIIPLFMFGLIYLIRKRLVICKSNNTLNEIE